MHNNQLNVHLEDFVRSSTDIRKLNLNMKPQILDKSFDGRRFYMNASKLNSFLDIERLDNSSLNDIRSNNIDHNVRETSDSIRSLNPISGEK